MNKALIVGICGGSGSGKTIIANQLSQKFKNSSVIINQDSFIKCCFAVICISVTFEQN